MSSGPLMERGIKLGKKLLHYGGEEFDMMEGTFHHVGKGGRVGTGRGWIWELLSENKVQELCFFS